MAEEMEIFDELEKILEMEQEAQKKGIAEGTVVRVERGKRGDFFNKEKLEELGIDPEDEVIAVHIQTPWGEDIREVYRVSTHKRSNLFKFFIEYGKPREGLKVNLKYDKAKGRWRVIL